VPEQDGRRRTSAAALAWVGALLLLLAVSLALVVYAGWTKWRELASEAPAQPAVAQSSAPSPKAPKVTALPKGGRTAAKPAGPKAAARAESARPPARPEAKPVRSPGDGRAPAESAPGPASAPTRPRVPPKRIPANEAARRLEALGAKLDRDHFQFAVARGELDQVRLFLEAGFSPNQKLANEDFSLFYLALIGLHDPKQEEAATLMLDYGADLEVRAPSGITPLMIAAIDCKPRFAEALIESGAQVNASDPQGTTALVWAQRASCAPVAALLKKRGAR